MKLLKLTYLLASVFVISFVLILKQNSVSPFPYQPSGHAVYAPKRFSIDTFLKDPEASLRVRGFPGSGWIFPFTNAFIGESKVTW